MVLAEFGYAGKLLPTFPLEPTAASRFAWLLKRHVLPCAWNAMLGREAGAAGAVTGWQPLGLTGLKARGRTAGPAPPASR